MLRSRPFRRHANASLSRQGKLWSKYRCLCNATSARMCLCGSLARESKHVYFKDLEARNLAGLFRADSVDRLIPPLSRGYRLALFVD